MNPSYECRGCGYDQPIAQHTVKERQFGTGEAFTYSECVRCGALSIDHVPSDLDRHYPDDYYAHQAPPKISSPTIKERISRHLFGGHTVQRHLERIFRQIQITQNSRILDIGCGAGHWLHQLHQSGYRNLTGYDPYLSTPEQQLPGLSIRKGSIDDAKGDQDLICYHHVLEHVPDPCSEIAKAARHLKPGGHLLIRVPIADSWARRKFGTRWVQWDAPRHLWVPTRKSLSLIAQENHLDEITSYDDSNGMQIWASRRYQANLSGLTGEYTPFNVRRKTLITSMPSLLTDIAWVSWLNLRQRGDQTAVLWQRPLK